MNRGEVILGSKPPDSKRKEDILLLVSSSSVPEGTNTFPCGLSSQKGITQAMT
jgi:hypothetical protein